MFVTDEIIRAHRPGLRANALRRGRTAEIGPAMRASRLENTHPFRTARVTQCRTQTSLWRVATMMPTKAAAAAMAAAREAMGCS
jgi:hypothetical protein